MAGPVFRGHSRVMVDMQKGMLKVSLYMHDTAGHHDAVTRALEYC